MAAFADALLVRLNLDPAKVMTSLAEIEKNLAAGAQALVQSLAAPLQEAAASSGPAEPGEEAVLLALAFREAARAAAELAAALSLAAGAMGEMTGAGQGFASLREDLKEVREEMKRLETAVLESDSPGWDFLLGFLSSAIVAAIVGAIRHFDKLKRIVQAVPDDIANAASKATSSLGNIARAAGSLSAGLTGALRGVPLIRFLALLLLFVGAVEDLEEFVQGGESALEGLMHSLGLSEEAMEGSRKAAEGFLNFLSQYGPALGIVAAALQGVALVTRLMGAAALSNPVLAFLAALAGAATLIIANWEKVSSWWDNLWAGLGDTLRQWMDGLLPSLPDWLKELFGIKGGEPASGDSSFLGEAEREIRHFAEEYNAHVDGFLPAASEAVSPATVAGPESKHTEYINDFNGDFIFQIRSPDPADAGREVGRELRRIMNNVNPGIRQ
ncbi:MAG: hypothetical protein LBP61_08900 [Desulfovibrio sp.]|jgi:hypothetical protein|nr:hypothetical protein [Desulfovibrio sp.]